MPTKEQVLKRMAQIEGIPPEAQRYQKGHVFQGEFMFNPLDNPSDWAVLIEKYRPNLFFWDSEYFSEKYRGKWTAEIGSVETVHESLPWAICLAIIEANGGMGDE